MNKYQNKHETTLWSHAEILDNDLERLEHDKNFEESDVYNSILDDEPAFHSMMNFPEDDEEKLYANSYDDSDDNIFEDRDSYKSADADDMYYFI